MSAELYRFSLAHASEVFFHKNSWFIYWKKISSCNFSAFPIRHARYLSSNWLPTGASSTLQDFQPCALPSGCGAGNSILHPLDPLLSYIASEFLRISCIKDTYNTCWGLHAFCAKTWESTQSKSPQKSSTKYSVTWVFSIANKVSLFSEKKAATLSISWPLSNRTCKSHNWIFF